MGRGREEGLGAGESRAEDVRVQEAGVRGRRGWSRNAYVVATAVACLLWSGSLVASKASYDSFGPFSLGLVRFGLAALVFVLLLAARGGLRRERRPHGRDLLLIALTGLLGTTLYFAGENVGVALLPASTSSLIDGAFPAMTLALECAWDRTRPAPRKTFGIALAFVGVGLLALSESAAGGRDVALGSLALLAGGACWAVYNIMMRPLLTRYSPFDLTAWQTLFGALGFIPFALVEGMPTAPPSPEALWSLAYLVMGCTVVAFVLYNLGLEGLEASTAASFVNLIPVFGLILSAVVLGEAITPVQLIGGAVSVAGIALSSKE